MGRSSAAPRSSSSGRHRCPASAAPARSRCPSSTRSGSASSSSTSSSHCTRPTAATTRSPTGGRAATQEMLPFQPARVPDAVVVAPDRGRRRLARRPRRADQRFPELKIAVVENGGSLGRAAAAGDEGHLQEDAAGLPRGAGRGDASQHLHQPVLGRGLRQASPACSARSTCCSVRTTRTPRVSSTRRRTSTTSSTTATSWSRKFMGGNLAKLMNVENTPIVHAPATDARPGRASSAGRRARHRRDDTFTRLRGQAASRLARSSSVPNDSYSPAIAKSIVASTARSRCMLSTRLVASTAYCGSLAILLGAGERADRTPRRRLAHVVREADLVAARCGA